MGRCVPFPVFPVLRSGDRHASAAPQVLHLQRQAVVRTGHAEVLDPVLQRVQVSFPDPVHRPVGYAEQADLLLPLCLVQGLHDLADRRLRVVPVQQENVDVVRLQGLQAGLQLFPDHLPVHLHHAIPDIAALGQHDDLLPVAPPPDPSAEHFLRPAVAAGTVKEIDAALRRAVQQRVRVPAGGHRTDRRPEYDPGRRQGQHLNASVSHRTVQFRSLPLKNQNTVSHDLCQCFPSYSLGAFTQKPEEHPCSSGSEACWITSAFSCSGYRTPQQPEGRSP